MGIEAWLTLAVVVGMVVALARDLLGPAAAVLGAAVVLFIAGVTDVEEAFGGFANPAPLTVAALYVVARAVQVSGAVDALVRLLLEAGKGADGQRRERRRLLRLLPAVALGSGVLNNTPIVATLAPQVQAWASQRGLAPARLLMPLSFAAILGGLLTTVGTSTTLVISGLLQASGQRPLGLFEISLVGLPVAVSGLAVVLLVTSRLLPDHGRGDPTGPERLRQFSVDMVVAAGGPVDGRCATEAGLRDLRGVYLAQVDRDGHIITPVAPTEPLRGGDVLSFVGKVDRVVDLQRTPGLSSTAERHLGRSNGRREAFFEAVVGADSPLVGRTLKEAGFRDRYGGAVVAIHRAGARVDAKLGAVCLRAGDTLLVLADGGFADRWRDRTDFLVVAHQGGTPPALNRKAPVAGLALLGVVVVAGSGLLSILQAALVAALVLLLTGALTPGQARAAVDVNVIVTIAAAFGVGAAVAASGLAGVIAGLLVNLAAPFGALGALAAVMLATLVLTEVVTNNAAAVLMFPVAQAAAATAGADPRPFAIAVAVMASAAFLTPIGYQTNTIVYGLGRYRFTDFTRAGLPLTVTVFAVTLLVTPFVWPL